MGRETFHLPDAEEPCFIIPFSLLVFIPKFSLQEVGADICRRVLMDDCFPVNGGKNLMEEKGGRLY